MALVMNGVAIPLSASTPQEKAEMAEQRSTRDALWRYLTPLSVQVRIDRRRRIKALAERVALRMEHRRGGDTLTRADQRAFRHQRQCDEILQSGMTPTRWQDLRRVAASKVYWIFRDRIEKPAGMTGYEWADWQDERPR